MCGYYAVNGVPACQNPMLLDRDLRDELGFTGWVVSDWGATHATLPSLLAGLDMEMWSGARYGELVDLVPQYVPETLLDRAVRRILNTMDRAGLLQQGRARPTPDGAARRAWPARSRSVARCCCAIRVESCRSRATICHRSC